MAKDSKTTAVPCSSSVDPALTQRKSTEDTAKVSTSRQSGTDRLIACRFLLLMSSNR